MEKQKVKSLFESVFKKEGILFFAPGRINLIGEHTDYNGGHVFPCAISLGTYGVASLREDDQVRFYSENFPDKGIISCTVNELDYRKKDDWANYPKGVIRYLKDSGYAINQGMDILFYGNLPNGAGLSSSASIEMLTGVIVKDLFQLEVSRLELIKLGQKVENAFIGVNSGIMDQFAVGMGKKDHAILLDCQTLDYELVPLELQAHKIVIMNTNKRRELADSKYNERRQECEEAVKILNQALSIQALGELTNEEFTSHAEQLPPLMRKRAKHAVSENIRTLEAAAALKQGKLAAFGKLMNESHESLRDDYEVTGVELDILVETAWQLPGVVGARMTGAGFGGCVIAIVEDAHIDTFIQQVGQRYQEKIGYAADFYIADISDGATILEEDET